MIRSLFDHLFAHERMFPEPARLVHIGGVWYISLISKAEALGLARSIRAAGAIVALPCPSRAAVESRQGYLLVCSISSLFVSRA